MTAVYGWRSKTMAAMAALACSVFAACRSPAAPLDTPPRTFETSFESVAEFGAFYIVPPGDYDSRHELSAENVRDGSYAHKAWIERARDDDNDGLVYLPHRAYPTVQLQKTPGGAYRTPCLVSFWVYLDITLADRPAGHIDDWFSFATLSPDPSDAWSRTVLANLAPDGYLRLVHVPNQGQQIYRYQASAVDDLSGTRKFPYRTWTRIDMLIDFDAASGYAKLWQNGDLVSEAAVRGGAGQLEQAHFGLYAAAALAAGTVYNDKLRIKEVADEAEALALVAAPW
jgi:hypothetical protein